MQIIRVGENLTHLDAAHVVCGSGTDLEIVARIPEPQTRVDDDPEWNEDDWREHVRAAVKAAGWDTFDCAYPVTAWIVWDPGRDQTEEEILAEWQGVV